MNDRANAQDRSLWLMALGGLALVLCCAGPALIVGGLLSTIGAAIANAIVIVLGLAIIAGGTFVTVATRRRARRSDDSGAPTNACTNHDRGRQ